MAGKGQPPAWEFLDDVAIADVAFRATGGDLETLFCNAAEATTAVMVDDPSTVRMRERREVDLSDSEIDMLLFDFLQELIFHKDAEELLLRPERVSIRREGGTWHLEGVLAGEKLDRGRHPLNADVKAVTMHRFAVRKTADGYEAEVVLDI